MLKTKFIALLIFSVFLLTACESAPLSSESKSGSADPNMRPASEAPAGGGGGGGREDKTVAQNQVSLEDADRSRTETAPEKPVERKIIRNADLSLESDAPEEAQQKITAIAESKGGFVVESTQSSSDVRAARRDTVAMTVRVPAEKFNETLDEIRKTGARVISETVKGQDVTEEFIDIEARLKTKRALEDQFLEIMKRSNSVADALNVQRELSNVRGEIEQIEGRKRFLENQSSLSTVKITLRTPTAISGSSKGFFYRLTEAVGTGFDGALSFILFFVTAVIALLPFLLLVVLPIYLILRYLWRKYRWKKRTRLAETEEIVREEIKDE